MAYYRHHPGFPPGTNPIPPAASLGPTPLPSRPIVCGSRERALKRFRNHFFAILLLLVLMRCSFTASTPWQPLPLTDITRDQHAAFALLTDFRHVSIPAFLYYFGHSRTSLARHPFCQACRHRLLLSNTDVPRPPSPAADTRNGTPSRGLSLWQLPAHLRNRRLVAPQNCKF